MPSIAIIGTIHDLVDGAPVALPGFHVNSTGEIPALAAYLVNPATPRCVFDGVVTWHYRFGSQEQAEQLLADSDLADPVPPPVQVISRRQGKRWLLGAGLLDQVEALVAVSRDAELRIWWEDSTEFHLGNPVLEAVFTQLGMPVEQLPAAFVAASQL